MKPYPCLIIGWRAVKFNFEHPKIALRLQFIALRMIDFSWERITNVLSFARGFIK